MSTPTLTIKWSESRRRWQVLNEQGQIVEMFDRPWKAENYVTSEGAGS